MNLLKPRLITFDVTGTLLTTKLVKYYENIGAQYGLDIDTSKLAPSFKLNYKRLTKEHPIYGKHTGLGWKNWWRTIVYNVFKDQNLQIDHHTMDKIATVLIDLYGTSKCWDKYPGIHDLLEYLTRRDIILGIISNFDERLGSILNETNIKSYFTFVITSYGLGVEKPDPLIFKEALKLSKEIHGVDILPYEALHIGDNITFDYWGAKKAGWNAILMNHDNKDIDDKEIPEKYIVKNLKDLKTVLHQTLNI